MNLFRNLGILGSLVLMGLPAIIAASRKSDGCQRRVEADSCFRYTHNAREKITERYRVSC